MSRSTQIEISAGYDKYSFVIPNRHLAEEINLKLNQRINLNGEAAIQKLTQLTRALHTPTHIRIIANLIIQDIQAEDILDIYPEVITMEIGYHD